MNPFEEIAQSLTDCLELRTPPVAVCLTDTPPAGVSASSQPAPAGCSFWERGAKGAFATSPKDHENCSVGMYTHHMPLNTPSREKNLNDSLKVFADLGYVRPEDIPGIATLKQEPKYVVYAPLSSTPMPPSVVLLFANSRQGLAITEAIQQVDSGVPPAMGRPACAAIPQAANSSRAALSLGCCGARAYLNTLTDDTALWALPGAKIAEYAKRIKVLTEANNILTKFHRLRRKDVEQGESPSVRESLAKLQGAAS
jgi:uncharacterized protein (DUF169 family)